MYTEDLLQAQLEARQAGRDFAVATIAEALGSTPRTNGKMIVYADGTTLGTVGGGAAELQVTKDAVAQIKRGCNVLHHYNVGAETADDGMQCGGKLSVLIEVYRANPLLVVVGGGHVGRCLIRVAKQTGFDVLLFDDRPAEAVPESAALADRFIRVTDFAQDICAADVPAGAQAGSRRRRRNEWSADFPDESSQRSCPRAPEGTHETRPHEAPACRIRCPRAILHR